MLDQGVVEALSETLSVLFHNQQLEEYKEASSIAIQMNIFIQRNTCIALGNLGRTGMFLFNIVYLLMFQDTSCNYIVTHGASVPLVEMMSHVANATDYSEVDMSLIINALFAFANLCKLKENQAELLRRHQDIFQILLKLTTDEIHFAVCFYALDALANLIHNNDENASALLNEYPDIVSKLVTILKFRRDKIKVSFAVVKCLFGLFKLGKIPNTQVFTDDQEFMTIINIMEHTPEDEKIVKLAKEVKKSGMLGSDNQ